MLDGSVVGQVIAGYRILKQLGEGGMGRAYLGEQNGVKAVLKEHLDGDREALRREAQFLAGLKHPRLPLVRTYEQGYMVMDFVEGENFEDHIEKLKQGTGWNAQETYLRQVADWCLQMADVLHYLHSQKPYPVIHRDIKPPNIILRPNGQLALIDFGIARHFKPEKLDQRIKDTCPAGTEGYMAPEFVMYRISTPLCDIYSLGVVLHYWLSGEQPDPTGSKRLAKLNRTGTALWDTLVEISEKCRHPEPTKRYQTATELAIELRKICEGDGEPERLEKPCPSCRVSIRASCRFCPVCGSLTSGVKPSDPSAAVHVNVEMALGHQQTLESILQAAESGSAVSLEHFRVYQKLQELEQDPGFSELVSLDSLPRVEKLPHQIEAVKTALGAMRGYCLLADEVGLGKTVEAGIIIKELMLRGLVQRILILAPRDLCTQWQQELFDKFDVFFLVFGRDVDYSLAWQCDRVIAPYKIAEDRFHKQGVLSRKYDLVIMDEAHHLIGEDPRRSWMLSEFARALGRQTTYFLMLSATPLHNDLKELHTLLTLLKPGSVDDFKRFKDRHIDPDDPHKPRNVQELRQRLQSVMIRNTRRRIAELPFPRREAHRVSVQLPAQHRTTFGEFRQFVRSQLWRLAPQNAFFRRSLQVLVESFHSSPESFAHGCDEFVRGFRKMVQGNVLDTLRGFQRRMTPDLLAEKVSRTIDILIRVTETNENKALVFTEYEDTANLLYQRIAAKGLSVVRYPGEDVDDGGERAMEALRAFQQSAAIMVCTQNASEGLNLQFANCMVNFDLPWDPMKLEQRIGRIQRIGGKPKVFIYNLFLQGTVEEDILDVLDKKIKMFGETIGQVEEILGNLADDESFDQIFLDLFVVEDPCATKRKIDDLVNRPKETSDADQLLNAIFGEGSPPAVAGPRSRPQERPAAPACCPACGQPVQEGAQFCDSCGRPTSTDVPTPVQRTSGGVAIQDPVWSGPVWAACRGCGAELSPGARFCDSCGMASQELPPSDHRLACCKGCGEGLPAAALFCDGCGRKVEA
jgi:serine/threonine protein kinase/superfamily II DNA or RNA helicase